ncbi:MAG: aminoacyl-tRNA hydrolase [Candidatus Absconditabacteria bacterium]
MLLFVGLGNPGDKYIKTRHNIGFIILDSITEFYGFSKFSFDKKYNGFVSKGSIFGEEIIAVKPQTYMNLSGDCVQKVSQYYNITSNNILVIHDDLDFDVGVVTLRESISAGGHNGIKDIKLKLGLEKLWRLKIGIGRPLERAHVTPYVLGNFSNSELNLIQQKQSTILQQVELFVKSRI